MQRVRRPALVAVLALLAGLALTGCRSQPDVAAYIGSQQIRVADVDRIADAAVDAYLAQNRAAAERAGAQYPEPTREMLDALRGNYRQTAVALLVGTRVSERLATEKKIAVPPANPQAAAEAQLPADTELARLFSQWYVTKDALLALRESQQPTERDVREIYDRATAAQLSWTSQPFEEIAGELGQDPAVGIAVRVRQLLIETAERMRVTINPRYSPAEAPVLSFSGSNDIGIGPTAIGVSFAE